ncbi:MAG: carotenoid biosynthesis protein [Anaerolineae bacterium]
MIETARLWIAPTFPGLSPVAQILLAAWVLTMVAVPILRWVWGDRAQQRGIVGGVLLQTADVVAVLLAAWGPMRTVVTGLVVVGVGWAAEFLGSHTGVPFGRYAYTQRLQPQLGEVPVLIPLAWLMMLPPAWAVGQAASQGSRLLYIATSALAFTAWDLFLDPQMVSWDMWTWSRSSSKKPGYFGIPWSNYAGWWMVSALITWIAAPTNVPQEPLIFIYGITWFLELFGQLFFWRLPGPALAGGLGMGLCLLMAVLSP